MGGLPRYRAFYIVRIEVALKLEPSVAGRGRSLSLRQFTGFSLCIQLNSCLRKLVLAGTSLAGLPFGTPHYATPVFPFWEWSAVRLQDQAVLECLASMAQ